MYYSESQDFFKLFDEIKVYPESGALLALSIRARCLVLFLKRLFLLPLSLFVKIYRSCRQLLGLFLALSLLAATLGLSMFARELFLERMVLFAKDVADWILFPVAVVTSLFRLFLAALLHPLPFLGF